MHLIPQDLNTAEYYVGTDKTAIISEKITSTVCSRSLTRYIFNIRENNCCAMLWLLLLATFANLVVGQTNTHDPIDCCAADIWSAAMAYVARRDDTKTHLLHDFKEFGYIYTDKTRNLRVTVRRDEESGVKETRLHDYNKHKVYTLFESADCHECRIRDSNRTLNVCVPGNATFLSSDYFGYGKTKLNIETWQIARNNSNFKITTSRLPSGNCYPLTTDVFFDGRNIMFESSTWFTRFKESIIDPSVFELSTACKSLETILNMGGPAPRTKRCTLPAIFSRG